MSYLLTMLIGLFGGVVSGLFGVGGGAIFGPLLILILSYNAHLAIGTSIAAVIPTAIVAAWRHASGGMVDWKTVFFLVLFSMIGAWAGATVSLKLDVAVLKKVFAGFLFLLSLKLFFQN